MKPGINPKQGCEYKEWHSSLPDALFSDNRAGIEEVQKNLLR